MSDTPKMIREDVALAMVVAEREARPFLFDRYERGQLMPDGIGISKASTLEQATAIAVKLAYPGDVLVRRSRTSDDAKAALDAMLKAEREKALREAAARLQSQADMARKKLREGEFLGSTRETRVAWVAVISHLDLEHHAILALIEQENGEA